MERLPAETNTVWVATPDTRGKLKNGSPHKLVKAAPTAKNKNMQCDLYVAETRIICNMP